MIYLLCIFWITSFSGIFIISETRPETQIFTPQTDEFLQYLFVIKIETLPSFKTNAFIPSFSISDRLLESSILTRYPHQ
jgi:hypothetical protein